MDTNDSTPMKFCHKCQTSYPATPEYFSRNKGRYDGIAVWCKSCMKDYRIERKKADPNFVESEREYQREYHKEHMQNSPDYIARKRRNKKDWDAEKNKDPEWVKAKNEYNKQRYHVRKSTGKPCPSETSEYQKAKWHERRANDPTFAQSERIRVQRRITRRRSLPNNLSAEDWQHALNSWNGCAICGQQDGFWHMLVPDHWIPLSDERTDNPGTVPWNIIPLCHVRKGAGSHGSCNQSKAYHDPIEWLTKQLGKRAAKKKLAEIEAYFATVRK